MIVLRLILDTFYIDTIRNSDTFKYYKMHKKFLDAFVEDTFKVS